MTGKENVPLLFTGGATLAQGVAMARSKPAKQLSNDEIERFMVAAEALHKSIVKPFISPTSDHYRALQATHAALLKTVRDITGQDAAFIQWYGTGPVRPASG